MSDLLTACLNATTTAGRPVVVSENHDAASINWVAGMSDPGEMIGCGMYQQLRRHAGEADAVYQARITIELEKLPPDIRAKIMTAGRTAATCRAGLDVSTGKVAVMVAGKAPWHGLGVNVRDAVDSADAIRLASLDWKVQKTQLQYLNPTTGLMQDADGEYGIVREDTGAMLGSVGNVYTPFQNSAGFEFLDTILGQFGAKYESAGAIFGGKKVWMLVRLPKQDFTVNAVDPVESYAIFTNAHDGTASARCFPTSQRVVCANTFRMAGKDASKGLSIRHTGNLKARVESAQRILGVAITQAADYARTAETLARTPVAPIPYFDGILDAVLDVTRADMLVGSDALAASLYATDDARKTEAERLEKAFAKRTNLLSDLLERYESDKNGVGGMRGTAWAALNAVTESANHGPLGGRYTGTANDRASRRFESVIGGNADEVMQIAYQSAFALVS